MLPNLEKLFAEFAEMEDWEERYDYLIDLGKQLPPLPDELRTPEQIVKGCMSTVWLAINISPADSRSMLEIQADSDSLIVKGLIVVLLAIFNHRPVEETLHQNENEVFARLGLDQHLSPQRRNGLFAMVKRLKQLAIQHAAAKFDPTLDSFGN